MPVEAAKLSKPELGKRPDAQRWHPAAVEMWDAIWDSPMAPEFDASDVHGIVLLLDLVHAYWQLKPHEVRTKTLLAAEIRLQRQGYGFTPLDRRRLTWEIERAEQAQDAGNRRRTSRVTGGDPRERF